MWTHVINHCTKFIKIAILWGTRVTHPYRRYYQWNKFRETHLRGMGFNAITVRHENLKDGDKLVASIRDRGERRWRRRRCVWRNEVDKICNFNFSHLIEGQICIFTPNRVYCVRGRDGLGQNVMLTPLQMNSKHNAGNPFNTNPHDTMSILPNGVGTPDNVSSHSYQIGKGTSPWQHRLTYPTKYKKN